MMFTTSNQWVLIGLTSYGIGCASARTAGVYTRVAYYQSWISTNTGNSYTLATSSNSANINPSSTSTTTSTATMQQPSTSTTVTNVIVSVGNQISHFPIFTLILSSSVLLAFKFTV